MSLGKSKQVDLADRRIGDFVICDRTVLWSKVGGCLKGAILSADDPRVLEAPEAFVGLDRLVESQVGKD